MQERGKECIGQKGQCVQRPIGGETWLVSPLFEDRMKKERSHMT